MTISLRHYECRKKVHKFRSISNVIDTNFSLRSYLLRKRKKFPFRKFIKNCDLWQFLFLSLSRFCVNGNGRKGIKFIIIFCHKEQKGIFSFPLRRSLIRFLSFRYRFYINISLEKKRRQRWVKAKNATTSRKLEKSLPSLFAWKFSVGVWNIFWHHFVIKPSQFLIQCCSLSSPARLLFSLFLVPRLRVANVVIKITNPLLAPRLISHALIFVQRRQEKKSWAERERAGERTSSVLFCC